MVSDISPVFTGSYGNFQQLSLLGFARLMLVNLKKYQLPSYLALPPQSIKKYKMAIEITLPVPYGQEDKFDKALVKLRRDGLKLNRVDKIKKSLLMTDGNRSLLSDYRVYSYEGDAQFDDTINLNNAFMSVAGNYVSLNGGRLSSDAPKSRSKVFYVDDNGKSKNLVSNDNNLNRLLTFVSKLSAEVFSSDYKPHPRARACDKDKFIESATMLLSRYQGRIGNHLSSDKTSDAAYLMALGKEPKSYKSSAWIDEMKKFQRPDYSSQQMQEQIVARFGGTELGSRLTSIFSNSYLQFDDLDLVAEAIESSLLNSSIKIDNSLIREFLPEDENDVTFTGVVVKTGVHHSLGETGELYYVRVLTDDQHLIDIVSGHDIKIRKKDIIDSASNNKKITVSGEVVGSIGSLVVNGSVKAPSVTRVKMNGYEMEPDTIGFTLNDKQKAVTSLRRGGVK